MRVGPAVVAGLSFPGESGHGGDSVRCRGHGGQQTDEHRDDLCTRFGRVGGRSLLDPTLPVRGEGELRRVHREKAAPQTLEIHLTFGVPDEAARDDDIAKTIDYAVVIARIRAELAERHFNLLETLGEYVIGLMLDEFRAPWVKISIAKLGIARGVHRVGVQIERSR